MTPEQRNAYEQLLKKRSVTLRKTTNDQAKKYVSFLLTIALLIHANNITDNTVCVED